MAITNLQQARQLYAMGQRVAKTMDGSRPGYRGRTDADTMSGSGYGAGSSSSRSDSGGGGSNRENYISQQFFSPPAAPPLSGGEGGIDPGFQNALRKQQIRQNTLTQSQKPNYGQFFNTRVPTYQAPTLRNRMRDLGGGVLSLINPLAGLAFRGYNYFKDQAPRAFRNFKSTNTLEEFIDKMRGYGRTMPTYSNNPAFGGIESLGIDPNDLMAEQLSFPYDTFNTGDPYKDNIYKSENTLLADVSQKDLDFNKSKGSGLLDLDTFKSITENPTLTQEELDKIRDGTIKAPTGIYAKT